MPCFCLWSALGAPRRTDSTIRLLPRGHQCTGQLTMMLTMVAYTFTGLHLLFGG
jgi:hypothetical protein